jgi:hypothetical protein
MSWMGRRPAGRLTSFFLSPFDMPIGARRSPRRAKSSPCGADGSPNGADRSLRGVDGSPHGADGLLRKLPCPPHRASLSPRGAGHLPREGSRCPRGAEGLPGKLPRPPRRAHRRPRRANVPLRFPADAETLCAPSDTSAAPPNLGRDLIEQRAIDLPRRRGLLEESQSRRSLAPIARAGLGRLKMGF